MRSLPEGLLRRVLELIAIVLACAAAIGVIALLAIGIWAVNKLAAKI